MTQYKLTEETKVFNGVTLHRIELTQDCKWGKRGTKGGWIQSMDNLSEDAWVSGDAHVYGNARVRGKARVYGYARVGGKARVYGDAILTNGDYIIQHMTGGEWAKAPLTILGSKHPMNISSSGVVRIGCYHKPIGEWLNDYERIGKTEGYSKAEIAEYRSHLEFFNTMIK